MNKRRVSDLHNDDPNDLLGQCVYMPEDVEPEIARLRERTTELERGIEAATLINNEHQEREARLRERVAELERATDLAIEINNKHQQRVKDLERSLAATKHEAGLVCLDLDAAEERSRLLLEAVRWLHSELKDCESCRTHEPAQIPEKFAPLIAEAVKETKDG